MAQSAGTVGKQIRPKLPSVSEEPGHKNKTKRKKQSVGAIRRQRAGRRVKLRDEEAMGVE